MNLVKLIAYILAAMFFFGSVAMHFTGDGAPNIIDHSIIIGILLLIFARQEVDD